MDLNHYIAWYQQLFYQLNYRYIGYGIINWDNTAPYYWSVNTKILPVLSADESFVPAPKLIKDSKKK